MKLRIALFTKPAGVPYLEDTWISLDTDLEGIDAVEAAAQDPGFPAAWMILVQSGRAHVLAWDADKVHDDPLFDSRTNDA